MASTPDPHHLQITLSPALRARVDELVRLRYRTQGHALAHLIALGLDKLDADDPVTDGERTRADQSEAAMGRGEQATTNGHTPAAA